MKACQDPVRNDAIETAEQVKEVVNATLNKKCSREDKIAMSELVADFLEKKDRLRKDVSSREPVAYIINEDGSASLLNARLPSLGDLIECTLMEFGLNPTEATFKWTAKEVMKRCLDVGKEVRVARFGTWVDDTLYVSCGTSHVVVCCDGGLEKRRVIDVPNVLFDAAHCYPEWGPTDEYVRPQKVAMLNPTYETPAGVPEYDSDAQRFILEGWLVSLIAGDSDTPALVPVGAKHSGKTTMLRGAMILLMGIDGDVMPMPLNLDHFQTIACSTPLMAIDNVDSGVDKWFHDHFGAFVTGGVCKRRAHYENGRVFEQRYIAKAGISTRTLQFLNGRDDVEDRCAMLFLVTRPDYDRAHEKRMRAEVADKRNGLLSFICHVATSDKGVSAEGYVSRSQAFGVRVASCMREGDPFAKDEDANAILQAMIDAAVSVSAEDDPLLSALKSLPLDSAPIEGSAKAVLQELRLRTGEDIWLDAPKGKGLVSALREKKSKIGNVKWAMTERVRDRMPFFTLYPIKEEHLSLEVS